MGTRLCACAWPSAQLAGLNEAVRHATWFFGAVENFRFFDLKIYALADVQGAVAEVKGEGAH